jgi:hypothetical protein
MSWNLLFLFLFLFLCEIWVRDVSVEPWDQVGKNVDNCKDLVDECEKSASIDNDVACRQVTISLTLGRAGWIKAKVREIKAEEAFAVNNTVKGVAADERRAVLDRHEGGEKGQTMSEKTWQDERCAACENGSR